jgi:hypothetical protein
VSNWKAYFALGIITLVVLGKWFEARVLLPPLGP